MSGTPVRLERDGALASMVLHDPPLNLFGAATFEALNACLDEVEGSDARALVWRAEGEVFTGGADVNVFQQIVEAGGDRSDLSFEPLLGAVRRIEALPIPDAGARPRPLPDRRARGLAGLRHDLGRRVGPLRPGRGGRRPDPGRRRHPADGRAGGSGAGARVRDVAGHLRRRDAGALERGQPRAPRRRAAREGDAVRAAAGGRPDQGARGDQADRARLPRRAASTRPTG